LLGDCATDVEVRRQTLKIDGFETPEALRDYWKANYGPTIVVYRNIADDPERVAELDRGLADLAHRFTIGDGTMIIDSEYLLLTAKRA
jgi:hypothetical protein